jgi:polyadenylate-binding protein
MTNESNRSKGYGFVYFETQDAADKAINKANGMLLAKKKVHVSRLMSSNQQVNVNEERKLTNIFINNFGDQLDEEKLRKILSKHGNVLSCKVNHLIFFL